MGQHRAGASLSPHHTGVPQQLGGTQAAAEGQSPGMRPNIPTVVGQQLP